MSERITDELRGFAPHLDLGKVALAGWKEALLAIADRIDAEHERQLEVLYRDMSDAEYVKLPVDANNEYICPGDVMDGYGKTIEVVELRYGRSGWVLISRDGNGYADTFAFTHHHAPTVEDVLREFAFQIGQSATDDDIVAEYAAKLQLKERMTATEELRRLLDERGVEYETYIEPIGFEHVKWNFNKHGSADFNLEFGEPWLTMYGTISGPEQAIAATLGLPVDAFTLDEMEDLYKDLCDECSDVMVTVDGVHYETDWGYGVEAVRYFIDMLRRRHGIEVDA